MTKVALVTGARRGIGKAIALALAKEGYSIAAVDLSVTDELEAMCGAVRSLGGKACAIAANIAEISSHVPVLAATENALGPITTLVNNAGVSVKSRGDLLDITPDSYDLCQDVNTRGTFFLSQAVAKRLLERKTETHRSIITVTSANATAVSVTRGEYCISKAGASMSSKLFAARLSNDGIGVYEIQPGFIETDMTAPSKARYDALIEDGLTVIKRFGKPEEVGRIAATLALGLLPYTSGQVIYADAGLLTVRY